jgi:hypothetical protein
MKTKSLSIAFMLLLSFCFSCSKEKQNPPVDPQAAVLKYKSPAGPNDKMVLDLKTQKIHATFYLKVASDDFTQEGTLELFEISSGGINAHGLAYRYADSINPDNPDNGEDVDMKIDLQFDNVKNWRVGDTIKIMSLNEKSDPVFHILRPYFEERLKNYHNREMTQQELIDWNNSWNANHEDELDVNSYEINKKKFTPKITKQDMIIKLTARQ